MCLAAILSSSHARMHNDHALRSHLKPLLVFILNNMSTTPRSKSLQAGNRKSAVPPSNQLAASMPRAIVPGIPAANTPSAYAQSTAQPPRNQHPTALAGTSWPAPYSYATAVGPGKVPTMVAGTTAVASLRVANVNPPKAKKTSPGGRKKRPAPASSGSGILPAGSSSSAVAKKAKTKAKKSPEPEKPAKKRRGNGKDSDPSKGLQNISLLVSKKVEQKKHTTYNEVADDLVNELLKKGRKTKASPGQNYTGDEKNVRRRVYDALNVLLALDIITKDKKIISWKGLPKSSRHECKTIDQRLAEKQESIKKKRAMLLELVTRNICVHNLAERNRRKNSVETTQGLQGKSSGPTQQNFRVGLPFLTISTSDRSYTNIEMSSKEDVVHFQSDRPVSISDDMKYLKQLGMDKISRNGLFRVPVSSEIISYCDQNKMLDSVCDPSNILLGSDPHSNHPGSHSKIPEGLKKPSGGIANPPSASR